METLDWEPVLISHIQLILVKRVKRVNSSLNRLNLDLLHVCGLLCVFRPDMVDIPNPKSGVAGLRPGAWHSSFQDPPCVAHPLSRRARAT